MKKVLVAMSGGIDSSVAAFLLKEKGFCVEGVFFRLHPDFKEAEQRARKTAEILNIGFCVFDFQKEFKQKVINYFLQTVKKGLTPNPCVVCNKEIKFDLLFNNLKKHQADFFATGHYVVLKQGRLFKARDKKKDQSYFLWKLNQKILKKALFPIGPCLKEDVRGFAKKIGLPLVNDSESQEICFINTDIEDFLAKNLGRQKGNIVDKEGNILAKHNGLWFYTLGQRKRIGLAQGPYYVLKKDLKKNNLIVTKNEKDLFGQEVRFGQINWILGKRPKFPLRVKAKIRYRQKPSLGLIKNRGHFVFDKAQRSITPGQSIVFYNRKELLGGGVIRG